MRKILIITGRYLPGYRDGGPVRSIVNLTQWMGGEYDLRIMCLDRDHGDDRPYPDITAGEYNTVGSAKVWYTKAFTAEDIEARHRQELRRIDGRRVCVRPVRRLCPYRDET